MSTLPAKRDVRLLVAEDIREEVHGKLSAVGLLLGDGLSISGPPPPVPNVAFMLPSLVFVFTITGGDGKYKAKITVLAPDKRTVVASADESVDKVKGKAAVFALAARPFAGPAFGIYTVRLELETKAKFSFPLSIDRGPETLPKKKRV